MCVLMFESSHRPDGIFTCFALCACRAAVFTSAEARWPSHHAPSLATQLLMCVLKTSHRPDGKMADMPKSTLIFRVGLIWFYQGYVRASHACKLPIAPMGKMLTRLPRVSLAQLRTLPSTTGGACRRDLESSHRPHGKYLVDMSNSILIFYDGCCLDLLVWSTCHLPLKLQKFPLPRWENC